MTLTEFRTMLIMSVSDIRRYVQYLKHLPINSFELYWIFILYRISYAGRCLVTYDVITPDMGPYFLSTLYAFVAEICGQFLSAHSTL